jgi:replicative DNA helicase
VANPSLDERVRALENLIAAVLNGTAPHRPADPAGYAFEAISSAEFFAADYRQEWLVQRLLVKGQPGIVGGPKKCLKTCTLLDLAISLASATPFLGRFKVYSKHQVLLVSAESGEATLQEVGRRIARARGIDHPGDLGIRWSFRLPQLANLLDRAAFRAGLESLGSEGVCILDPLYLAMLAGADCRPVEAGNLYSIGPLLLGLAQDCQGAGWTPLLCHHARKNLDRRLEPMELDDLSFAGVAEFARQWLLESRREPYELGTGSHRLWLVAGGSTGQSGTWALDVEEGTVEADDDSPTIRHDHRRWEVTVRQASEVVRDQADEREQQASQRRSRQEEEENRVFLEALDRQDPEREGVGFRRVREAAQMGPEKAGRVAARLITAGIVEEVSGFRATIGSNANRPARGIRRAGQREEVSDHRSDRSDHRSNGPSDGQTIGPVRGVCNNPRTRTDGRTVRPDGRQPDGRQTDGSFNGEEPDSLPDPGITATPDDEDEAPD